MANETFFVIDSCGFVSQDKDDNEEQFQYQYLAMDRAEEIARINPSEEIRVAKRVMTVVAPIGETQWKED